MRSVDEEEEVKLRGHPLSWRWGGRGGGGLNLLLAVLLLVSICVDVRKHGEQYDAK